MTKLMEWVTLATLFLVPWLAVITNKFENGFTEENFTLIVLLPVILLAIFGVVSVAIIGYRVYTFNDCTEAAQELQQQILEAKKDLAKKGLKFTTPSS